MFPWDGYDYFEMAKEGILRVLEDDDLSVNGKYEFGLVQYCTPGSPGYVMGQQPAEGLQTGTVHWFPPLRISDEDDRTQLLAWIQNLEPCMHFTRGLIDVGIESAADALISREATIKQIVYIGTGEYRLPRPCPTSDYNIAACNADANEYDFHCGSGTYRSCNRACETRSYVSASASQVSFSAVHVGPNWKNVHPPGECASAAEATDPYGISPDYCSPPASGAAHRQPDRSGFLQELARWSPTSLTSCVGSYGRYARVEPAISFEESGIAAMTVSDVEQRIVGDIENNLRKWFCLWVPSDNDDGDALANVCDNCPQITNPRQRDCNNDGIGDLCQTSEQCDGDPDADADLDGLCDALDTCPGGDDCLVRYWLAEDPTHACAEPDAGEPLDLSTCGCDCDQQGGADACQMALQVAATSLPDRDSHPDPQSPNQPDTDINGVPDCAEGPSPECTAIPTPCDISIMPDSTYSIDFRPDASCGSSCDAVAYLDARSWKWEGDAGAVEITDSEYTIQCGAPPDYESCIERGVLTLDANFPSSAALSGPLIVLPDTSVCTPSGNCPLVGPWSYVGIDVDFFIPRSTATPGDWHVVIKNGCHGALEGSERAHLLMTPISGDPAEGQIRLLQELPSPLDWTNVTTFHYNRWIRLRIAISNVAQWGLDVDEANCLWLGEGESISVVRGELPALGESIASCAPNNERYFALSEPLNSELTSARQGALQVVIYSASALQDTQFLLGEVRLHPVDGCHFHEGCHSPCECFCGSNWQCD